MAELKRRRVLRAAALYAGSVWALAQGISQLSPSLGMPESSTRWFLVAAAVGFPFWIVLAWLFELTPDGLRRESASDSQTAVVADANRKGNPAVFVVMALAIVLLLTVQLIGHKERAASGGDNAAAPASQSIAVLPLSNQSSSKDEQYFSDGLSEDLITSLTQFAGLKVTSRASAFQFRDSTEGSVAIGKALGVAYLIEGSVQHAADAVRVTAHLISTADGQTIWSQHYDRPYKDLFALQDAITAAIAGELKTKVLGDKGAVVPTGRPPGGSLEAYDNFLKGVALGNVGSDVDLRKSIDFFDAALRIDPKYAEAHAMAAGAWGRLAVDGYGSAGAAEAYAKAADAANAALALDPGLALAHMARGYLLYSHDFDWNGAQAEYQRALQLAPNDDTAKALLAAVLGSLGQLPRALDLTRETLVTNPMSGSAYANLAFYYQGLGRLDDAERAARTRASLLPGQVDQLPIVLSSIEVQRGHPESALTLAHTVPAGPYRDIATALALQIGDDRSAANAALDALVKAYPDDGAFQIAEVHALRGDADDAFKWLEHAWTLRDPGVQSLLYDPYLLRLKADPRFAAFCREIGLPAPAAV